VASDPELSHVGFNEGLAMSSFEWMELQTLTADIETARDRLTDARKRRDQGRIRALEAEITQAEKRRLQLVAHISTSIATAPEPPPPTGKAAADPAEGAAPVAQAPPESPPGEQPQAAELAAAAEAAAPAEAEEDAAADDLSAAVAEAAPDVVEDEALPPPAVTDEAGELDEGPAPARGRRAKQSADDDEASAAAPETPTDEPEAAPPPLEPQDQVAATASPAAAPTAISLQGGTNVWDQLSAGDIERAKRELGVRRAEMLARHADELKALEAEQGQIDTLEQAIASFLQKFNTDAAAAVVKLDQERELRQQGGN